MLRKTQMKQTERRKAERGRGKGRASGSKADRGFAMHVFALRAAELSCLPLRRIVPGSLLRALSYGCGHRFKVEEIVFSTLSL